MEPLFRRAQCALLACCRKRPCYPGSNDADIFAPNSAGRLTIMPPISVGVLV